MMTPSERPPRRCCGSLPPVQAEWSSGVLERLSFASSPDTLHVRLDGPPAARVERVVREEGLSNAEAWDRLRCVDRIRSTYLQRLYGRDPEDPTLYHLVFDTTALPLEACLERIAAAALDRRGTVQDRDGEAPGAPCLGERGEH